MKSIHIILICLGVMLLAHLSDRFFDFLMAPYTARDFDYTWFLFGIFYGQIIRSA